MGYHSFNQLKMKLIVDCPVSLAPTISRDFHQNSRLYTGAVGHV